VDVDDRGHGVPRFSTAAGLDERLGEEYGDYARKAAGALEDAANKIAAKDPDELIDDTREFRPQEPGRGLGRRGDHRLRAGPAGQVRPRPRPQTTKD
jgi:hypothetical protein